MTVSERILDFLFKTDTKSLLVSFAVFLTVYWLVQLYRLSKPPPNFPPGPTGWPVVGLIPEIVKFYRKGWTFQEMFVHWGKCYGGVIGFNIAGDYSVVLNDFEAIKEAFRHPDLNDRPPQKMQESVLKGKGLLFSSGDTGREQRKFSLSVLRNFGVGKRSFESDIAEESRYLIEKIRSLKGKPFNPFRLFGNAVSNVICSVTFSKRYEYEDETFKRMLEYIDYILELQIVVAIATTSFPILKYMPFGPIKKFRTCLTGYRQFIRDVIKEHHETFDNENLRDFIDVYFSEMRLKREQRIDTRMNEENMESTIEDLFLAGSETTATTLRWSMLLMMAYPDVQSRVQREVDAIVSRDRLPTLSDKPDLPYTEATIQEIMRFATIAPVAVPHYTQVDTTFRGYNIPKRTTVVGNLWSVSRDPKLWNDPDEFKPERFLDENNTFHKPEHHISFGLGRRACIGEQLAKMELFIFFSHMLHQFSVKKPYDSYAIRLQGKSGAIHAPFPFEICLEDRMTI